MKKSILVLASLPFITSLAWATDPNYPATGTDPNAPSVVSQEKMQMTKMQESMLKMHEQMHKIMQSQIPAEREQLMQEHAKMMHEHMHIMHGIKGGVMDGGMGAMQ